MRKAIAQWWTASRASCPPRPDRMSDLRFNKDGVPIYDGSPELYVAFRRAALNYAETIEWKKRSLVGPRLQAALEGSARLAVEHMPPGWVSHEKGAEQLLDYLKRQVQSPTLAEAGRTMSRFFYGIKRRRGEGMAAWIVRHDEALLEAKRTLAEAIQEYGPGKSKNTSSRGTSGKGGAWTWSPHPSRVSSRAPSENGVAPSPSRDTGGETERETPFDETSEEHPTHEEEEVGPETQEAWQSSWWSNWKWSPQAWSDGYAAEAWSDWRQKETMSQRTWGVSEAASEQAEKFLPDFVIAWLLLQRSGLDATEKSVIVANLKNQFRIEKVKEALKLTWPDEELRRRDAGKHAAMFTSEEDAMLAEEDEFEETGPVEWETAEEDYAYQALETEAHEAYAALQDARRTLRDAREKQAMMRKNRSFYSGKASGKGKASGASSFNRPPVKCFKCGGPHLRRDCPEQTGQSKTEQGVHFVFNTWPEDEGKEVPEAAEPRWLPETALATQAMDESMMALEDVVKQGKAIIDGGATSSLGSEDALQQIASLNWASQGQDGIEIIPGEAPSFRFGNNGRHECLSTALLQTRVGGVPSKMKIHLHDIPGQPVLLSVKGLRALGAVIDFERNEAIFRKVDPRRVARLETTESGHQLFPLAGDVLKDARVRQEPFESLCGDATPSVPSDE